LKVPFRGFRGIFIATKPPNPLKGELIMRIAGLDKPPLKWEAFIFLKNRTEFSGSFCLGCSVHVSLQGQRDS